MSNNKVSQLPPTLGIKDPETRQFLDALTNAWEMRSGNTNGESPERFLTAGEFSDAVSSIGSGAAGGQFGVTSPGAGSRPGSVAAAIGNLESSIRKGILYQLLTTPLDLVSLDPLRRQIDGAMAGLQGLDTGIRETNRSLTTATTSFTQQINSAVSRIGAAEAAIITEQNTRAGADFALTNSLNAAVSRIGTAESAILTEASTRSTKDNALASAINSIWASIGGNQAVIQDGQLAAVTPSAVSATKWNQVQAAAIDVNTGLPSSAIVRQEFTAYAGLADDKLNAIYSVRAQVSRNGQTVVGGFGLAAVGGAAGGVGPEISFGVTADRFFIAPPASSSDYNDATLIGSGAPTSFPFIALSTPQTVGSVTYQPGVYIRNANIADAAIDTAKIRDLSVDTIKIKNQALSDFWYWTGFAGATVPDGTYSPLSSIVIDIPQSAPSALVIVSASVNWLATNPDGGGSSSLYGAIGIDGTLYDGVGISVVSNFSTSATLFTAKYLNPGQHTISLNHHKVYGSGPAWSGYAGFNSINVVVVKK